MAMIANSANVLRVSASSSSTSLKRMQMTFPNPNKSNFPLITAAIVSAGLAHTLISRNSILSTVGGNGTNGGFGGGGGDGGGGPLPIQLLSYPVNADEDDKSHEITEADLKDKHEVLAINSGGQVVMVGSCFQKDSGGTYTETKVQLQKLLEKGGDLEAGTNPGGTTKGLRPVKEHTLGSFSSSWHWDKENGGVTYMPQEDDVKTECNIVTGCGGPLTLLAAEIRIPVRNTHVYAFAEHGNDLGSSKDVKGNPTEVYRRMGQGSSYGVGAKLGLVRAEYAIDHNSGTGALFFRFGERF